MEVATGPYADHEDAVQHLETELRKADKFAKGLPNNALSAQQWKMSISPQRDLHGGFPRDWQEDTTKSAVFVERKMEQVAAVFVTIIQLESGKIKPENVQGGF